MAGLLRRGSPGKKYYVVYIVHVTQLCLCAECGPDRGSESFSFIVRFILHSPPIAGDYATLLPSSQHSLFHEPTHHTMLVACRRSGDARADGLQAQMIQSGLSCELAALVRVTIDGEEVTLANGYHGAEPRALDLAVEEVFATLSGLLSSGQLRWSRRRGRRSLGLSTAEATGPSGGQRVRRGA